MYCCTKIFKNINILLILIRFVLNWILLVSIVIDFFVSLIFCFSSLDNLFYQYSLDICTWLLNVNNNNNNNNIIIISMSAVVIILSFPSRVLWVFIWLHVYILHYNLKTFRDVNVYNWYTVIVIRLYFPLFLEHSISSSLWYFFLYYARMFYYVGIFFYRTIDPVHFFLDILVQQTF